MNTVRKRNSRATDAKDARILAFITNHPGCTGWTVFKEADIELSYGCVYDRIRDLIERKLITIDHTRQKNLLYIPAVST